MDTNTPRPDGPLPCATGVDFASGGLVVHLADGRTLSFPLTWFPALYQASDAQRQHWQLIGSGVGIHWPEVDADLSVRGLLNMSASRRLPEPNTMIFATSGDSEGTIANTLYFIVVQAHVLLNARRVWLFGSRARQTATRVSDIDIAVEIDPDVSALWSRFVVSVQEDVPTLMSIDLVDIDTCAAELRIEILKTGRLLYERA